MKITYRLQGFWLTVLTIVSSSIAWADEAAQAPGGGMMGQMLMLGVIFVMMYFVLIRPQNKRQKEQRELIASIGKGDEIVLASGILGKVSKVGEQFLTVAIAEGIEVTVQRQSVAQALPKGTLKSVSN